MTMLSQRDTEHVFESLRKGLVPERGISAFAVGIDKQRGEMQRQLELAANGEGTIKFLRGGYGCGKTFMARLALLDAQQKGFAPASWWSPTTTCASTASRTSTARSWRSSAPRRCPRGALGDILDRWIGASKRPHRGRRGRGRARLRREGAQRLNDDLVASLTGGKAPPTSCASSRPSST
jgi:hypothetical protein